MARPGLEVSAHEVAAHYVGKQLARQTVYSHGRYDFKQEEVTAKICKKIRGTTGPEAKKT